MKPLFGFATLRSATLLAPRFLPSLMATAVATSLPLLAQAQVRADAERPLEVIVTTATRSAEDAYLLTENIDQLGSEEIELIAPVHIQEALVRVPGVNLQRGDGLEYLPAIRSPVFTGAGACGQILMMEDGIPLRPAGFCNVNELFESHSEQAQRIEVTRGLGSVLYGSNAMHGTINIITAEPVETPINRVTLEAGPHEFVRFKLAGAGEDYGMKITLADDGGFRDETGYEQQKFNVWRDFALSDMDLRVGFALTNLRQETAGYIDGRDSYKNKRLAESNLNPEAYRDASAARAWVRMDFDLGGSQRLVITPYMRFSEMEFLQHFLPGQAVEKNGQTSLGLQSAWYLEQGDNRWIAGVDAEYVVGYLKETQDRPTPGTAFLQETIPVGKHYDYEVDALMLAPFVRWEWDINERWLLRTGLRYEYMGYDYDNRMLAGRTRDDGVPCGFGGCRFSRPVDRDDSFNNWSPEFGLIYQLSEQHHLFVDIGRGFRAPHTTELYRLQREQNVADLDSERLDSLSLGIKGRLDGLSYELVGYLMAQKNVIFRDSDFFNVSDGKTKHRGVELLVNYRFSEQFDLGVNASFAKHEYDYHEILAGIDIHGNEVDTAPRHFGSAQLGWNFVPGGRLELEWVHTGEYYLDPENLRDYPGHDIFNLRTQYRFNANWSIAARIHNLTDERYAERADYTSFSQERYFPGEPRSVYVSASYSW